MEMKYQREKMIGIQQSYQVKDVGMLKRRMNRNLKFIVVSCLLLVSLSYAQTQNTAPPSASDCATAADYGRTLPGCDSTADSSSQMQNKNAASAPAQLMETAPQPIPQLTNPRPDAAERTTVPPRNPNSRATAEPVVRPHTEFEQIVADTVGRPLPLFGQLLFAQPPSTFAPTDKVQVPSDYVIGPDDELQIRIWGQLNADLRVVVDRSGQVYIPKVGQVSVAGIHYSQLGTHLKSEVQKLFRNFELSVSMGRIRSIQVFVVGQARYPGTYTISSLSTLVNAIFASGGPSPHGSLRDVQVQRDGRTIAHLDFYELLIKGDKSKDVRLWGRWPRWQDR
jgi:protein involved in polysaccharide export with SLBB domain